MSFFPHTLKLVGRGNHGNKYFLALQSFTDGDCTVRNAIFFHSSTVCAVAPHMENVSWVSLSRSQARCLTCGKVKGSDLLANKHPNSNKQKINHTSFLRIIIFGSRCIVSLHLLPILFSCK